MRRWTPGPLAALLLVLAGWVLAPPASACTCAPLGAALSWVYPAAGGG